MNISISNIAWELSEDDKVSKILNSYGVTGIEIAPTKIWDIPLEVFDSNLLQYKTYWNNKNIEIVAMQSLLFSRPDLTLFGQEESRRNMKEFLTKIIILAEKLGIKNLVFGSPKNRIAGEMNRNKALDIAIPFFLDIGNIALNHNLTFCIEPNPTQYGCDFITTSLEGIELVKEVNHSGFQLHLDSAAMTLSEENYKTSIEAAFPYLSHFHISEPHLNLIGSQQTSHEKIADILIGSGYEDWVSIEMKNNLNVNNIQSVESALDFVTRTYRK